MNWDIKDIRSCFRITYIFVFVVHMDHVKILYITGGRGLTILQLAHIENERTMLSKKSLIFILLIVTRINLIFSTMSYESPVGVHEIISGPTSESLTVSVDKKEVIKLVVGAKSDEECKNSDQELIVTEIIAEEESLVNPVREDHVISQPLVEEVLRSKEQEEKENKRKLKKWLKINDSDSYYSLPFGPGDYLPAYKAALRSELKKEGNVADCNKKKTISYVVAHEMSHLKEMNHSAKFWSIVRKIDPNYQASIVWLRKYGTSLYQYLPKA